MWRFRSALKAATIPFAIFCGIALLAADFVFVGPVFGFVAASLLSLFMIPSLVVTVRLYRRRLTVRRRELAYLAVLSCAALAAAVFVVHNWYDAGMDRRHAEDVRWAEFGRLVRHDPAFQNVWIRVTTRKQIYWVEGTVASKADLDRLKSLAADCGIARERLDGPYVHSTSLTVVTKGG